MVQLTLGNYENPNMHAHHITVNIAIQWKKLTYASMLNDLQIRLIEAIKWS